MDYFVKNALIFLAGLTASALILQGDTLAGLTVYLLTAAYILNDQLSHKK